MKGMLRPLKKIFFITFPQKNHAPLFNISPIKKKTLFRTFIRGEKFGSLSKSAAAAWATLFYLQQEIFYMHHPTNMIAHTMAFVTPVVKHWLVKKIAQWVHQDGSTHDPSHPTERINRSTDGTSINRPTD